MMETPRRLEKGSLMLLSRIAFVWLIGVILLGCDDISSVKTATLVWSRTH